MHQKVPRGKTAKINYSIIISINIFPRAKYQFVVPFRNVIDLLATNIVQIHWTAGKKTFFLSRKFIKI